MRDINKAIHIYIYKYYIDAICISSRNIYGADMKQREKRGKRKKYIYTSIYIYIYFYLLSKQTFNWLFIIYTYAYIYIYIHILYIHTHIYILYEVSYYILITCLRESHQLRVSLRRFAQTCRATTHKCDPWSHGIRRVDRLSRVAELKRKIKRSVWSMNNIELYFRR